MPLKEVMFPPQGTAREETQINEYLSILPSQLRTQMPSWKNPGSHYYFARRLVERGGDMGLCGCAWFRSSALFPGCLSSLQVPLQASHLDFFFLKAQPVEKELPLRTPLTPVLRMGRNRAFRMGTVI